MGKVLWQISMILGSRSGTQVGAMDYYVNLPLIIPLLCVLKHFVFKKGIVPLVNL